MIKRKLPAAREGEESFVKLTSKQWIVYYWLVSKAYWNGEKREGHYFIYTDSFSYCDIRKDTGILDNRTIKKAFDVLELCGKICITEKVIYIPHPDLYTYLSINLINYFVKVCSVSGLSSEIIVAYSILKRLKELDEKNTTFSLKLLVVLLGHNENDLDAYLLCRVFVAFLESEQLIEITKTTKQNKGGTYVEYTLNKIKEDIQLLDFDGEKEVEIQNKIKDIKGQA